MSKLIWEPFQWVENKIEIAIINVDKFFFKLNFFLKLLKKKIYICYLAGYLAGYPVSGHVGYPVSGKIIGRISGQISIRYNPNFYAPTSQ